MNSLMNSLMDRVQTLGEEAALRAAVGGVDQVKLQGRMLGESPQPPACLDVLVWADLEEADSVGRM